MRRTKLTKRTVDACTPEVSEYTVTDTDLQGFHLRVFPSGRKSYAFRYKRNGSTRRTTIGDASAITADAARKEAQRLRGAVSAGDDPARERVERRKAQLMKDLWVDYLELHARPHKRERSVEEDERLWRLHLSPAFGDKPVRDLSRQDIDTFMRSKHGTPGAANRSLSLLSKMMNLAWEWGIIERTPCKGVQRYHEAPKEPVPLSSEERQRLAIALREEELRGDAGAALAIRLIAVTGARLNEVLKARSEDFLDTPDGWMIWHIPATNTKQRRVNQKPIHPDTASLLRFWRSRHAGPALLFPSPRNPDQPRYDLKAAWKRVRKHAGLEGRRLHDFRHDMITSVIAEGGSLELAGQYAGHNNSATTNKYSHAVHAPLRSIAGQMNQRYEW